MSVATYQVEVDWSGNGVFGGGNEDVSAYVKSFRTDRGYDDEQNRSLTGSAIIVLNNEDKRFSPDYSAGPLYGNLKPGRKLRIRATFGGNTYNMFTGYIKRITPRPDPNIKECTIQATDLMDILVKKRVSTTLWQNKKIGWLVDKILDEINWSAVNRRTDPTQDTVAVAFWEKDTALEALRELEQAHGGMFYIGPDGFPVFEERYHKRKWHRTSLATINNDMVSMVYDLSDENLYNEVRVTIYPWKIRATMEIFKSKHVPILIQAGATLRLWAKYYDPIDENQECLASNVQTLTPQTDYKFNDKADGTGTDRTDKLTASQTNYARSALLSLTSTATKARYLTKLRLRGRPITPRPQTTRKEENAASIAAYGRRTFTLDNRLVNHDDDARNYCWWALRKYKDLKPRISIQVMNSTDALLTQMLAREISHRITIVETQTGVNKAFYLTRIEHEVEDGGLVHRTTWW